MKLIEYYLLQQLSHCLLYFFCYHLVNILNSVSINDCQIRNIKCSFENYYNTIERFSFINSNLTRFGSFGNLSMLKFLNLSLNKTTIIFPYNFYNMKKLQILDLLSNEIKVLNNNAFCW